jgi:hypothetical protein
MCNYHHIIVANHLIARSLQLCARVSLHSSSTYILLVGFRQRDLILTKHLQSSLYFVCESLVLGISFIISLLVSRIRKFFDVRIYNLRSRLSISSCQNSSVISLKTAGLYHRQIVLISIICHVLHHNE